MGTMVSTHPISAAEIQTFENDGVVCLRNVIDLSWVERLRRATKQVLRAPSAGGFTVETGPGVGRFRVDRFVWTFNDEFKAFSFESPLPQISAAAMRSKESFIMLDLIFVKEPHTTAPTVWHHDQPYAWYDGSQVCQFWVPLDRVDLASGALEFVRGSHKWGKWFNPVRFQSANTESSDFDELPDIDGNRSDYDIVHFETAPGDCLLFSELTLHSAPGNATERPRRGVSVHYAGDDARYSARHAMYAPSRDSGIKPGDRFGNDLFPRVWPRD